MQAPDQPNLTTDSHLDSDETLHPVEVKPPPSKTNRMKLTLLLMSVLIIILAGAYVYRVVTKDKDNNKTQTTTQNPENTNKEKHEPDNTPQISSELERFTNPTTGEVWADSLKKVTKQGFLTGEAEQTAVYYEAGSRNGGTIYIVDDSSGLGSAYYLFEKSADGKVSWVAKPSSTTVYNDDILSYFTDKLASGVYYNEIIQYDSLSFPSKGLDIGNTQTLYLKNSDIGHLLIDKATNTKETVIKELGKSKIVKSEWVYDDTKLTNISYFFDTPAHMRVTLSYDPFSEKVSDVSWSMGNTYGNGSFKPIAKGCGLSSTSITRTDSLKESDFVGVGKTKAGQVVYQLIDNNYKLFTKTYEEYKEFYSYDATQTILSKDDFSKSHGLVFIKDVDNSWLVYVNDALAPEMGCAKPVVYLYPEKTTNINIKIGADVKVSEPLYDKEEGWNVTAKPDGSLMVNGAAYSSLFWEGPGHGTYPYLEGRGTVVKTSEALSVIESQLYQQGFKNNEVTDFLAYWSDKMPKKPYTRLTWLTTQEMNILAPLQVTPRADTVIRTFLDYEGLDRYVQLAPQEFNAPERKGFSVVEWGGISPYKPY